MRDAKGEVKLVSYAQLHGSSGKVDEGLFRKVLLGISCRDYEAAVEAVPGAIGMSKSQVSREFKKATETKLKEFQERDLGGYDVVAVFIDGKTFADDQMVLALGVTIGGRQGVSRVRADGGGERSGDNLVAALAQAEGAGPVGRCRDGGGWAKALRSGALTAFPGEVLIQRCQWHKRENVTSYLPRKEQKRWRGRMQRSYDRPTYEEAKTDLKAIRAELAEVNQSAVASLD